jgi:Protein of unknown function (DUF3592)
MNKDRPASASNPFAPPPTAFPPAPRSVRLRAWPYGVILFFLVFAGVGVSLFAASFGRMAMVAIGRSFGVTVPGRVTDKTTLGRGNRARRLTFQFQVDGEDHTAQVSVDGASYDRVNIGDPVQVRVWPAWPGPSAAIEDPVLARSWSDVCFFGFAVLVNGILILLVGGLLRKARIWRNLARCGIATVGRITDKRVERGKVNTLLVDYRYKSSDGTERDGTQALNKNDYDALQVGQAVTVLFDPLNPKSSIIYRCCEFEVVGVSA